MISVRIISACMEPLLQPYDQHVEIKLYLDLWRPCGDYKKINTYSLCHYTFLSTAVEQKHVLNVNNSHSRHLYSFFQLSMLPLKVTSLREAKINKKKDKELLCDYHRWLYRNMFQTFPSGRLLWACSMSQKQERNSFFFICTKGLRTNSHYTSDKLLLLIVLRNNSRPISIILLLIIYLFYFYSYIL